MIETPGAFLNNLILPDGVVTLLAIHLETNLHHILINNEVTNFINQFCSFPLSSGSNKPETILAGTT